MVDISVMEKINTAHLFPQFIQQLNKDTGTQIFTFEDRGMEKLQEKLQNYLFTHPEQIDNIIYRADVNENKAREIYPDDFFSKLTLLILQRVAQKVIFRNQYSS